MPRNFARGLFKGSELHGSVTRMASSILSLIGMSNCLLFIFAFLLDKCLVLFTTLILISFPNIAWVCLVSHLYLRFGDEHKYHR